MFSSFVEAVIAFVISAVKQELFDMGTETMEPGPVSRMRRALSGGALRRWHWMLLATLLTVSRPASTWADDVQTPRDLQIPTGVRACKSDAYLVDQDIEGVAVRKGPNTAAALITRLPALRMQKAGGGLELYGAEVAIVGTDGRGWFLIEEAEYEPEDDAGGPPRKVQTFGDKGQVYRGRGWVHGSRLGTEIVATRGLRAGPGPSEKMLHPLKQKDSDPEIAATFLDCEGGAVRLRATEKGKVLEGWINPDYGREKLCSNQRTTCS